MKSNTVRPAPTAQEHSMETRPPSSPITPAWPHLCLRRLRRLLELTPEAAPYDLTPAEAQALLEWGRIAVFADCHEAGAADAARTMLKGAMRR
jgi:hypothetical protein